MTTGRITWYLDAFVSHWRHESRDWVVHGLMSSLYLWDAWAKSDLALPWSITNISKPTDQEKIGVAIAFPAYRPLIKYNTLDPRELYEAPQNEHCPYRPHYQFNCMFFSFLKCIYNCRCTYGSMMQNNHLIATRTRVWTHIRAPVVTRDWLLSSTNIRNFVLKTAQCIETRATKSNESLFMLISVRL